MIYFGIEKGAVIEYLEFMYPNSDGLEEFYESKSFGDAGRYNISEILHKRRVAAAKKLIRDKELVQLYSRGLLTKEEIEYLGVKLTMPI